MKNKIIYINNQRSLNEKKVDPGSGSGFWSVEGTNVQFTWFDVPANTKFLTHRHESEQITYVLDGELLFRSENTIYKLSTGDCILIPSNTDHEVWTESVPAKAVDAWSPVNETFSNNSILVNK